MSNTPNPVTATLPRFAGLQPSAAPVAMRSATPRITVLQRINTGFLPATMLDAVDGSTLLDTQEIARVIAPMVRAVDALRTGRGLFSDWVCLSSAVNIAEAIERKAVVRGLAGELVKCRDALQAIGDRAGDTEAAWTRPTLYSGELIAANDLVRWHKFQLQQLSYREYAQARDYAIARVRSSGGQVFDAVQMLGKTQGVRP